MEIREGKGSMYDGGVCGPHDWREMTFFPPLCDSWKQSRVSSC